MKLGTISWTFGIDDLDELFSKVKATGFDYLQFSGDHTVYDPKDVLAAAKQYEVELLAYDPFNSQPPEGMEANLENGVAWYKDILNFALALKVPMLTLQGLSFWTVNQPDYASALQMLVEAVRQLDVEAQQHNLTLTYEACNHYELPWIQTADELLYIKEASGAKQLQLVLDSFHMNIAEQNMVKPLHKIGKDLLHSYHVSDSGRGGIGTGHIDFVEQFKTLQEIGFDGLVLFEIVIPSVRPYKFPMNEKQLEEMMAQGRQSLNFWKTMMESE